MDGFRFALVLLTATVIVQVGRTQTPNTPMRTDNAINKVYSLADLGDDPNLCKWIAESIPHMISPGAWNGQNICYYEPAKLLALHQPPEVHAQVEAFLANLRKSLPREKSAVAKRDAHVVPAQFNPNALTPQGAASASQAYPVPAALQTPKHLFHFIIRYEGEGIIDSNVTKFAQALAKASMGEGASSCNLIVPAAPPPPNAGPLAPATYYPPMNSTPPAAAVNGPRTMPAADAPPIQSRPVPDELPGPMRSSNALPALPANPPPPPSLAR